MANKKDDLSNIPMVSTERENKDCFIIMPISDCDGYEKGHFKRVYENIIKPAVIAAGYNAKRADETKSTNLIQLDILKQLLDAPIAICDLSSRNPNVLFELGIRQAFNKPVVLIQEEGTPAIFDISGLRYIQYSKIMRYDAVLNTHKELKNVILETMASLGDGNINSIVNLLALSNAASIPNLNSENKENLEFNILRSELSDLKRLISKDIIPLRKRYYQNVNQNDDYDKLKNNNCKLENMTLHFAYLKKRLLESPDEYKDVLDKLNKFDSFINQELHVSSDMQDVENLKTLSMHVNNLIEKHTTSA